MTPLEHPPAKKTARLNLRLPPDLLRKLEMEAIRRGVERGGIPTLSEVLIDAIEKFLKELPR